MTSRSSLLHQTPFRFGLAFVIALALTLAVATVAVAWVDEFGGASDYVKPFAPYTEPYAGTVNIGPHVPSNQVKPFAPYTEPYAATENIGPHVPSNLIKSQYAPYTQPFWGQYLER